MRKKKIVILGSTGSIGTNAVKTVMHLPNELEVYGLAAKSNIELLSKQAKVLNCQHIVINSDDKYNDLKSMVSSNCKVGVGEEAMIEMVTAPEVDMVLCAIVGTGGLRPVLSAIRAGKDIALASKEILVMAGEIVMQEVAKYGVSFIPVDSEHSAIFQCLEGKKSEDVSKIILTASGGPFRGKELDFIKNASYAEALAHPTWDMGPKVTIDSASLMNKALEMIEARWLFDVKKEQIDVIVHPQSIIHSMVEFLDGTVLAQMSSPDMRFPIQYALTYPTKHSGSLNPLNFAQLANLSFENPNRAIFPSLDFAYYAIEECGTLPAVMNAANEIAVQSFIDGKIKFHQIWNIIEKTMANHKVIKKPSLDDIIYADKSAREYAIKIDT